MSDTHLPIVQLHVVSAMPIRFHVVSGWPALAVVDAEQLALHFSVFVGLGGERESD